MAPSRKTEIQSSCRYDIRRWCFIKHLIFSNGMASATLRGITWRARLQVQFDPFLRDWFLGMTVSCARRCYSVHDHPRWSRLADVRRLPCDICLRFSDQVRLPARSSHFGLGSRAARRSIWHVSFSNVVIRSPSNSIQLFSLSYRPRVFMFAQRRLWRASCVPHVSLRLHSSSTR